MTGYFGSGYWQSTYFASGYWGPSGSTPSLPVDIEAAILARFQTTASLAALGSRMFTGNVPQFPARPHLILSLIDGRPELNSSTSRPEQYHLHYTIVSESRSEGRDLMWAAYSALIPRAENPPMRFQDGSEDTRLLGNYRYYSGPGPSSAAQVLWYWTFDCVHRIGRDFTVG